MALKFTIPFPLFSPASPNISDHRPATEVRFARWNNANAQKFILQERAQKEIEDEIRVQKRFESAYRIADDDLSSSSGEPPRFKSIGTPSSPSKPSIPGKASKYSKPPKPPKPSHPAFRRIAAVRRIPIPPPEADKKGEASFKIGETGVSYVIPGAPFEFQYSYTETPKVKPVKLREPPFAPFGPGTMPRPWTGRAPLPPSKKKLKEFDSFQLPPPHKKGVKPVQAPGPFLPGSGPKYVMSREETLGEPLMKHEVKDLIEGCIKTRRQLNIGRDGLTHNMLDNIHALWKRKRVCKIKCKGVCTVDMDNVHQQLEEKTGGKIIYSRGGVIFLFRGRNYNARTCPRFPLMLWKPVTPVYPRLVQRAPDGLTLEEAREMRKKGRKLTPICKLAKNGVYISLVQDVREAFEECELVRINCQGLSSSDYHKIGAKLKDLVPCVLISFECEHILMWRGKKWTSLFSKVDEEEKEAKECESVITVSDPSTSEVQKLSVSHVPNVSFEDGSVDTSVASRHPETSACLGMHKNEDSIFDVIDKPSVASHVAIAKSISAEGIMYNEATSSNESGSLTELSMSDTMLANTGSADNNRSDVCEKNGNTENESEYSVDNVCSAGMLPDISEASQKPGRPTSFAAVKVGIESLWKQALESGSAILLEAALLDADIVYEKSVSLAQSAPPGPIFVQPSRKVAVEKLEKQKSEDSDVEEIAVVAKEEFGKRSPKHKMNRDLKNEFLGVAPQGSLKIDELAKLLA